MEWHGMAWTVAAGRRMERRSGSDQHQSQEEEQQRTMSPTWPLIFIVMPGRVPQVQWPNPTERKDGRKVGGGSAGKWMII